MDPTQSFAPSDNPLVDVHKLGLAIFGENSPSERTLRSLAKRGLIPAHRIGRLVRFDVRLVRAALDAHCLVQGRKPKGKPTEASRV